MLADDTSTSAFAQEVYSAEGGTYFTGLPTVANSGGFFTGLMTEWYHGEPYYANLASTVYTTNLAISSGWLWMDEFNANNEEAVFAANASAPYSFTGNPSSLQEFSYNGTTEYASGTEFVSGVLPSGTITTTSASSTTTTSSLPTTSTQTVTQTVQVTVLQTVTSTATATVTQPVTETVTSTQSVTTTAIESVTTTSTSTQSTTVTETSTSTAPPSTTTQTQTTTQTTTATSLAALPVWSYVVMALLLIVGLAAGYSLSRRSDAPPRGATITSKEGDNPEA